MIKFPYGISDFKNTIMEEYYYCDRTDKIPLLENAKSQLFIRPRRFGKSLLLSMLENYYDVAKADEFDRLFGHLKIGQNPTKHRNSYFILRWDFSCVNPTGSVEAIQQALFDHINVSIEGFLLDYENFNLPRVAIDDKNAIKSIQSLLNAVKTTSRPIYLLIDEYDNFANTVMMGVERQTRPERYNALVHDEGILRTLFKAIKSSTSATGFDRVFITGVSPVVMSDITSGYNIAENIYFHPKLNALCGFTPNEVRDVITKIVKRCGWEPEKGDDALEIIKTYYNGYQFAFGVDEAIYNPTLCLYFFKAFQEMCCYPRKMLDANLAMDESKLEYIAQIPMGRVLILSMMEKDHCVTTADLSDRFSIREMLDEHAKNNTFVVSFLYFFGVLTLAGENEEGEILLKVPNLVTQGLYVERVQKMLLPEPMERDDGIFAAKKVYQKGNMAPLCEFVEHHYFAVLKNRDYRWANELTLKTAFLTLLYNDILYIMDSEPELDRKYADLTMIIRPDKRHFKIFDVLIEFKFIRLKEAGITGEAAKSLSEEDLYRLPEIEAAFLEGEKQVMTYGKALDEKYVNLRLQKFVVVSLGFERVCFKALLSGP